MEKHIQRVTVSNLHGWLDLEVELHSGVNILYGPNGTGKTTLLHILANVLDLDIDRFLFIEFAEIRVALSDGTSIRLAQTSERSHGTEIREVKCYLGNEVEPVSSVRTSVEDKRLARYRTADRFIAEPAQPSLFSGALDSVNDLSALSAHVGLRAMYFPAFRSMLDTAEYINLDRSTDEYGRYAANLSRPPVPAGYRVAQRVRQRQYTTFGRTLFGPFTPVISYTSVEEIRPRIESMIRDATDKVSAANARLFSQTVVNSLSAITQKQVPTDVALDDMLEDIQNLLASLEEPEQDVRDTYSRLQKLVRSLHGSIQEDTRDLVGNVLLIYKSALEERLQVQQEAFAPIERFCDSVNSFLEGKAVRFNKVPTEQRQGRREPRFALELANGKTSLFSILSSGERQILCLLFSATLISGTNSVVLVDEPELSLHIDWQRRLISEMQKQMGDAQFIICTHSIQIGADHDDDLQVLAPDVAGKEGPRNLPASEADDLANESNEVLFDDVSE